MAGCCVPSLSCMVGQFKSACLAASSIEEVDMLPVVVVEVEGVDR